jgi:small subunit ribosomal protein S12
MTLITRLYKKTRSKHIKLTALNKNPQVRGIVIKTRIVTPKKPNSARRPAAKITLVNKNVVTAHIPGIGHNLRKHSTVLVRGGGARDLPGVSYTCIRGAYDLSGVANRNKRRSIYGIALKEHLKKKVRRKFRQL